MRVGRGASILGWLRLRRAGAVLLGAACALALAVSLAAQPDSVPLAVDLPDNPMAGARLFVQKSCARCHALGGDDVRVGPDLGRLHLPGAVLDLAGAFWNHSPVMREKMQAMKIQPPQLSRHEMADLVAFLTAYRYYLAQVGEPGDPVAGGQVFAAKGCERCHGRQGAGGRLAPDPEEFRGRFSAIFLAQAMWNHGAEMASAMEAQRMPWPSFAGREMGDLLAYLQEGGPGTGAERVYFEPGSPRRGRETFAAKQCDTCHAIAGAGGRGGPDLGTRGETLVGSEASIAGLMWNHSLGMTAEFRRRGIARVSFSGQEMADVIAYLYFVNYANVRGVPAHGARLFTDRCGGCHTAGGGRRVASDLAAAAGLDEPIAFIAAMWNHAPEMERELRARGLAWPQFEPGEAADLLAYLLTVRAGGATTSGPQP
jgi:mono/diheme cytochrome c family protein